MNVTSNANVGNDNTPKYVPVIGVSVLFLTDKQYLRVGISNQLGCRQQPTNSVEQRGLCSLSHC